MEYTQVEARPRILPALVFVALLLACYAVAAFWEQLPFSSSPPPTQPPSRALSMFEELMLPQRRPLEVLECENGAEGSDRRWVVLYENASSTPEGARIAVYYRQHNSPPSLLSQELSFSEGIRTCRCECDMCEEDLLPGFAGKELLVQERCTDHTTNLSVYRWNEEQKRYVLVHEFPGTRVSWEGEEITVDILSAGQTELARRCRYAADGSGQFFHLASDCEFVFFDGLPEDMTSLQYPESALLAFYHQYRDALSNNTFFTSEVFAICQAGGCGCLRTPAEVEHVHVLTIVAEEKRDYESAPPQSTGLSASSQGLITATVTTTVRCNYVDGAWEQPTRRRWTLVKEEGRWRMVDVKRLN
jgi:hypothetical protein